MSPRRLLLPCLLLAACPPRTPSERPPDGLVPPPGDATAAITAPTLPDEDAAPPAPDDPDAPDEPGEVEPGDRSSAPRVSTSRSDNNLADTLAPRGSRDAPAARRTGSAGCEGGARRIGDTWKVECNSCSCGDDGLTTCTTMACGPNPR